MHCAVRPPFVVVTSMARRTIVFVRQIRTNGPRKSRVRMGLKPILFYIGLVALTALAGFSIIAEDLKERAHLQANLRSAKPFVAEHGPR